MSVYGEGMGNAAQAAATVPLPEFLSGFMAWINGVPAPLYYVSPNQVNIQIPYETQAGAATLELGNPFENIQYRFPVTNVGPGIFTLPNGRVNPSSSGARGQIVTLFVTGDGAVTPSLATGATPSPTTALSRLPKPRASVSVTVGGQPSTIDFVGIPSGLVGVTQINFRIPEGVAAGEQPVVVTVGAAQSNTARILVQ
jgi:adhesin/invasin